jgi:hypothetical protein
LDLAEFPDRLDVECEESRKTKDILKIIGLNNLKNGFFIFCNRKEWKKEGLGWQWDMKNGETKCLIVIPITHSSGDS